ncbi:hypothetical protein [Pseudomonas fluorescens]|uniref:Uncharacterized protein n=1 Tax=Pseudomonas fluorescens TaxID=294 RepID=A0A0F4V6J7_PSEFL|nr:hypothetical protein [Pseudomonas fluorescens]KJZ64384.1 hypothetical protein VD17_18090 [Pseudomonas fluorescens]
MTTQLSEEEMRRALFGATNTIQISTPSGHPDPTAVPKVNPERKPAASAKAVSSKLRVTLHVSNVFEGDYEVVHYDTSSLSKIVAEMDAKKTFKKKYKYITVESVTPI